jgi:archaeosortase B (VPXXXP-CTERM-specific)
LGTQGLVPIDNSSHHEVPDEDVLSMTELKEPAEDEVSATGASDEQAESAEAPAGAAGGSGGGDVPVWKNPAYRFVFLFLVYLGTIAYGYPKFRVRYIAVIDALAVFTADVEYFIFNLFADGVTVAGKVVAFKGFAVHIIEECTGVYEVLIFTAAVLAFPTSWAKKWIGLGLGVPLLYSFNVFRIGILILVGKYFPEYFDFMHLYFWQATLILMITSVWLLWITQVVNRDWSRTSSNA